jgi:hypothetical protein
MGVHQVQPYSLWLDLQTTDDAQPIATQVAVLPIHELFHSIWEAGPMQFRMSVLGEEGVSGLKTFWDNAQKQPWTMPYPELREHPQPSTSWT